MEFQIIQLSDIHFKKDSNSLIDKKEELFNALKNHIKTNSVLMVTGDSAFSGANLEFDISTDFYNELIMSLNEYTSKDVKLLVLPGNHDCQELTTEDPVRESLLKTIQESPKLTKIQLIDIISNNLSNYFDFEKISNSSLDNFFSSNLLKAYKIDMNGKKVIFYCYNTAFQSILNEVPGKMVFPLDLLDMSIFKESADLKISCFHHPFGWLNPDSNRKFRKHIDMTSNFYFTGHEHIHTKSQITDLLNDNVTYHIEGSVLQDSNDEKNSGFNVIDVDFSNERFKVLNYEWNGEKYSHDDESKWVFLDKRIGIIDNPFEISTSFKNLIEDAGANFTHPIKPKIEISDIYIYPELEILYKVDDNNDENLGLTQNSKDLLKGLKNEIRIILSGSENIGKTTLIRRYFIELYNNTYIPIFLEGQTIKSTNIDDLQKLLGKKFLEQYASEDIHDFEQLDKAKIVIIIDDLHRTKINIKYKARLLKNLINNFPNLIISGNELMSLEDILVDETIDDDLYSSFSFYQIKEFGYVLRSELINRWNILGREDVITEEERIRRLHYAESIMNNVIGVSFVPSYPFFILTILQSIEVGNSVDLTASTFGHYYNYLIKNSLREKLNTQREITEYENYLSEFTFYLHENSLREFDSLELEQFDKLYRNSYTISHNLDTIIKTLLNSRIFKNTIGILEFNYSYIYYYFLSNHFASNIHIDKIKAEIISLTDKLYIIENSNILMFLTHHSKDDFLLKQLLNKANSLFSKLQPSKLEDDVKSINELGKKIPELVFESRSVDDYRKAENELKDQFPTADFELAEEDNEIDEISEFNTAFKTLEIIGHILKNNYGKINNETIENLIEYGALLGLRSLKFFFSIIEENSEYVINQANSLIAEIEEARGKKIDNPKKIETLSKSTLFGLCNQFSYSIIKKISDSLGTEVLDTILEKVYVKQDYNSMKLIKLSIKLDHYKSFPINDMKRLEKEFHGLHLPTHVMKRLVFNHLYLYPTNHKRKSQILSILNIPTKTQLKIDQTSTIKKKDNRRKK